MNEVDPKIYRFGPFHFDLEQRLLFRGGAAISLTQKAFDTLAILVERQGKIVDKAELIKLVWPEMFVEENNLTQNISTLRKSLGEGEYIETIPRRGYCFVTMVVEDPPAVSASPARSEPIRSRSTHRIPRWIWGLLSTLAIAGLVYFTAMRFRNRGRVDHTVDSLVVLPFMNLSATRIMSISVMVSPRRLRMSWPTSRACAWWREPARSSSRVRRRMFARLRGNCM